MPSVVIPDIAAEAAVWVARLHGPDRSSAMERDFAAWQARSEQHRLAFERCTEVWQEVPGVSIADAFSAVKASPSFSRTSTETRPGGKRWALALSVMGILALGAAGFQHWRAGTSYGTGIGEQQLVILDDGTRLTLNTATKVKVNLTTDSRTVLVEDGEALFEIAKDTNRPFVVRAGGSEVVALGTVFSVRFTPREAAAGEMAVTLIEGQVSVRPEAHRDGAGSSPSSQVLLHPGERARVATTTSPAQPARSPFVDRPHIDQVVAWKRGEALFDDASLEQAVAEMNRYSRTPIVLVGTAAEANHRISGSFRTGDNVSFARAIAKLHGLSVRELPDRLELAQYS